MNNYNKLQKIYELSEIEKNCVNIDFCYAFIFAMATSELELQQWMPLLFINEESCFSSEKIACDFAQVVLAIYQQANSVYNKNEPLPLMIESSVSGVKEATAHFSNGYLQALMMIDNTQMMTFPEGSAEANLQQTCLLLLDKLACVETPDMQKITLFEQLPSNTEILTLLPVLLSRYGQQCLAVKGQ